MKNCPPTKAALIETINRANFVSLMWKQCLNPRLSLPDPIAHSWNLDGDRLLPVTTKNLPAPKAILELVRCSCKGNCVTLSCSCKKHNLNCTDTCIACENTCENRNEFSNNDGDEDKSND